MGHVRYARVLTSLTVVCLAFELLVPEALAQFNARGRGSAPSTPPKKPTPAGSAQKPPTGPSQAKPDAGDTASRDAASREEARTEQLIARYRKLILEKPGEEVPLTRLTELLRARDGNLDALISELTAEAQGASGYNARVALAGVLLSEGRPSECEVEALSATKQSPRRIEAWQLLAACQLRQGNKEGARASQQKALPLSHDPERSLLLRSLRDLSLDLDDLPGAREYHRLLTVENGGNLFQRGELGRELLRRGRADLAVAELKEIAKRAEGDPRALAPALRDLGEALIENQELDLAITTLTKASATAQTSPGLQIDIETKLSAAHRLRGTLSEFLDQLEKKPITETRAGLLGRLYEEEGQTEKAIAVYKNALSRGSGSVDLRLRLASLYELSGDLESATAEYKKLVKSEPGDVPLSLRYLHLLMAGGWRDQAVAELKRILEKSRSDPSATLMLLDLAEKLGEVELQKSVLTRLQGSGGADARFLVELGSRYYRSGQEAQARAVWDRILTVHQNRAEAHVIYGEVLLDHEQAENGVKALKTAASLDPKSQKVRRSLALGLERGSSTVAPQLRSQYQKEALKEWQVVLTLSGDAVNYDAQARRHIVRLVKKVGHLRAYVKAQEKAFAQTPPDLEAGRLLVEAYLSEKQDREAVRVLTVLLKLRPGDREALRELATAHERLGEEEKVIATLKRLIAVDPKNSREYYAKMATAAERSGSSTAALSYAELSVKQDPSDPLAHVRLGDLYLSQGRPDEATRAYRAALALDDRISIVYFKLSELVSQKGENEEALRLLLYVVRNEPNDDIVARAARRALGLSVPLEREDEIERVLRPLAIGQPERPVYRELYFEVLSARALALLPRVDHGEHDLRKQARDQLQELCRRSSGLLLSGLASESGQQRDLALLLLPFGDSASTESALFSFAESEAPIKQRKRALLAIGRTESPLRTRKIQDFLASEQPEAALTQAALWVLSSKDDFHDVGLFFPYLDSPHPEVAAQAALGIGRISPAAQMKRAQNELARVLTSATQSPKTKAAAALSLASLGPLDPKLISPLSTALTSPLSLLSSASLLALSYGAEGPEARVAVARALLAQDGTNDGVVLHAAAVLGQRERGGPSPRLDRGSDEKTRSSQDLSTEHQIEALLEQATSSSDTQTASARRDALVLLKEALKAETEIALLSSATSAERVLARLSHSHGQPLFLPLLRAEDLSASQDETLVTAQKAAAEIYNHTVSQLRALSAAPHEGLRKAALLSLSLSAGSWAKGALTQGLDAESDEIFQAAARSLVLDASQTAVTVLTEHAKTEEKWTRRRRLAAALGSIFQTPAEPSARSQAEKTLSALTRDENALVREEAKRALVAR